MNNFERISKYIPRTKTDKINPTTLAQLNTILGNQRTYLAYLRTGFAALAFSIATSFTALASAIASLRISRFAIIPIF